MGSLLIMECVSNAVGKHSHHHHVSFIKGQYTDYDEDRGYDGRGEINLFKLLEPTEIGKMFCLLGLAKALMKMIGKPLFSLLYKVLCLLRQKLSTPWCASIDPA